MGRLRRARFLTLGLLAAASCARVAESAPKSRLGYAVGEGGEGCPDAEGMRRAIVERLGEDPFGEPATREFRVAIAREGDRLVGRVTLVDEAGTATGLREFVGVTGCAEVVQAMALAISLAENPELAFGGNETNAPSEPEAVSPAPELVVPKRAPPSAVDRPEPARAPVMNAELPPTLLLSAGGFALMSFGTGPEETVGAAVAGGARLGDLSLSIEGRYDSPTDHELGAGARVHSSLLAGALVPCLHFGSLSTCAVGLLGRIRANTTGLPNGSPDSGLYAAAGARLGVRTSLDSHLALELRADGLATLIPVKFLRNRADELWHSPAISGAFGLGLVAQIP